MSNTKPSPLFALTATMFLLSGGLVLFELLLTRIFGVVLFSQFAHLALLLALLGISVGAVMQHTMPRLLPAEALEQRMAWVCLGQTLAMVLAVACALNFPMTEQWDQATTNFAHRGGKSEALVHQGWFAALLPILMSPFCFAGLGFAAAFQHRKAHIGRLYGADLLGGGFGAVAFLPALGLFSAPDVVFVCSLMTAAAAGLLFVATQQARWARLTAALGAGLLVVLSVAATGTELLTVRYAAGYSEREVLHSEWTALTRLALHDDGRGSLKVLLDNSSASVVVRDARDLARIKKHAERGVVYQLHQPGARVAVIAASAGPELAVAQSYGYTKIDAIDIAADIGDMVARRYPDAPLNPYTHGETNRIMADGRAAILHANHPYDIIQMVHANLHSNAGMMATAWSPGLLETTESFHTYLDRLSDDGTISFGKGHHTGTIARAAAAALRERGVKRPETHIAYIKRPGLQFMLVKKRPWQAAERDRLLKILGGRGMGRVALYWDPLSRLTRRGRRLFRPESLMTDDRPYLDRPELLGNAFSRLSDPDYMKKKDRYLGRVYDMLIIQVLFALSAGVLLLLVPLVLRGGARLGEVRRVHVVLLYVACLGYGYLAIETVLIHELILFVGHPTYAVTAVILGMLLSSGIGSFMAGRLREESLLRSLMVALVAVILLASLQAWVVPDLLKTYALGLPSFVRILITIAVLSPLGFAMGFPFPLGLRLLPDSAASVVPWAWALNGWMSVVASIATVLVSRNFGYQDASMIAVAAYVLALLAALGLPRVGMRAAESAR